MSFNTLDLADTAGARDTLAIDWSIESVYQCSNNYGLMAFN